MSGICAAVAAARHGAKVILIHDRPVLGGNASSEVRMWICGAQGLDKEDGESNENLIETGIIEEIRLKNMHRNPQGNWSIWDSILYEIIWENPNISLYANCTCMDGEMDQGRIRSIKSWQMTTETWLNVEANVFIDCSGDGILIPISGAEHRIGRESSAEYGEDIQPEVSDKKTMGMSCLLQTRETNSPSTYIAPEWANVYQTDEDLNNRRHDMHSHNFWWLELGGNRDSIHDAEEIKKELLQASFGIWDHIKNKGDHGAENWQLEWAGFLPGKRESRRYIGDYIMNQNDVRDRGRFDDMVAYGGWPMDDHHPDGLNYKGDPTQFHGAPAPYGIPYRSLYSHNINNLMFAGRNISVTHAVLSSTRVMSTCSVIGQAVGTAAAMAVAASATPREIGQHKITELKNNLMNDDCYLPWNDRPVAKLTQEADISSTGPGNPELLRDGHNRSIDGNLHAWRAEIGDSVSYTWKSPQHVTALRLVLDSNLSRGAFGKGTAIHMPCRYTLENHEQQTPATLVKGFHVEARKVNGEWETIWREDHNYQRFLKQSVAVDTTEIRLTLDQTWGDTAVNIFDWEVG